MLWSKVVVINQHSYAWSLSLTHSFLLLSLSLCLSLSFSLPLTAVPLFTLCSPVLVPSFSLCMLLRRDFYSYPYYPWVTTPQLLPFAHSSTCHLPLTELRSVSYGLPLSFCVSPPLFSPLCCLIFISPDFFGLVFSTSIFVSCHFRILLFFLSVIFLVSILFFTFFYLSSESLSFPIFCLSPSLPLYFSLPSVSICPSFTEGRRWT